MTVSDEEKRQIMQELAQGKPGLTHQEPVSNPTVAHQKLETENYENFDDFARRPAQSREEVNKPLATDRVDAALLSQIQTEIADELKQAKAVGQLRSERIKEIVQSAVAQMVQEIKLGSGDLRLIVKSAISAVSESLQEKGSEIKEEVTASIEGAIEGINSKRQQSIARTQAEVRKLEEKLETEEDQLQQEIERLLNEVEAVGKDTTPKVRSAIESAINTFKNSEEFALMRKRYAQLRSQAAILKANSAARYGGRYQEVKEYLEEAKSWYERTRTQTEVVIEQADQQRSHLEERLREAGEAIAKKKQQLRQILRNLLQAAAEFLQEQEPPTSEK